MERAAMELDCHRADSSVDSSSEAKADMRKNNKPVMEKKRRAKINGCLGELKSLILDALQKDPARHSKLEKADILEMTVRHLQNVQRQQLAMAVTFDPSVLNKVKNGFTECGQEVARYVDRIDGVDTGVRKRLLTHVERCVSNLQQMTPLSFSAMASPGVLNVPVQPMSTPPSGDFNNNGAHARLLVGLQSLMASRLLSGELGPHTARAPATAISAPPRGFPPPAPPLGGRGTGALTPSAFERVRPAAAGGQVLRPIPIPIDLKKRAFEAEAEVEGERPAKRRRVPLSESSEESEVSDLGLDRRQVDDMWRPW